MINPTHLVIATQRYATRICPPFLTSVRRGQIPTPRIDHLALLFLAHLLNRSALMSPHGAARSLPGEDTDSADSSNPNPETPHPSHPSPSGTPSTASIPPELSQSRAQSASNRRAFASSGRTKSPFSTVKGEQGGDEPACMTRSGRVGTRSSLSLRAFPGRSDPAIGYWSGCADLG